MSANLDNLEYRKRWHDLHIDYYEGFRSNMADFHMHEYYEISLILEGDVRVLLSDRAQEGTESRIVMTRPQTPHFIACSEDTLYRRINVLFSEDFIDTYSPENKKLFTLFGKSGNTLTISAEQCTRLTEMIKGIKCEANPFRQKLLLLYLISSISDMSGSKEETEVPSYITGAITYIGTHYSEKIVAEELAWKLGVGRTTLMTGFKAYTGSTLNNYLLKCRLRQAVRMLNAHKTEQETALECGFGDTCSLIRSFKKAYGKTPKQYITENN